MEIEEKGSAYLADFAIKFSKSIFLWTGYPIKWPLSHRYIHISGVLSLSYVNL